jgi:hypothetical protein
MPRFFFNFGSNRSIAPDLVGQELPDAEAANAEAAQLAADIGFTSSLEGEPSHYEWLEVLDEDERPVARLPVSRAVREPNRSV